MAQWLEGPWEHDPVIEKLLAEDRDQPRIAKLPRGASKPGRNDKCPCGSGEKFKHCCIDSMTFQRVG